MPAALIKLVSYNPISKGEYTIHEFTDESGKRYKTFRDEVADQVKPFLQQDALIEYTVTQKPSKDGSRVFTDNMLDGASSAEGVTREPVAGDPAGLVKIPLNDIAATRVAAFRVAAILASGMVEEGEVIDFDDVSAVADAILAWASK
jgi:hypothetical protein